MIKLISAHIVIRNAVLLDYPFVETCLSILPFCDELVILCERTDDGTVDLCESLRDKFREKVRIFYEEWWNPARKQDCIGDAINRCIDLCEGKYHLQLQADEVYHEAQIPLLLEVARRGFADWGGFTKLNFWSSFEKILPGYRIPQEIIWFARRSLFPKLRSYGDGCSMGTPDSDPNELKGICLKRDIQSFHYGYVRHPVSLVRKFHHTDELYGWGVPGYYKKAVQVGKIDWSSICTEDELYPFLGTHPATMVSWINDRRADVESGQIRGVL